MNPLDPNIPIFIISNFSISYFFLLTKNYFSLYLKKANTANNPSTNSKSVPWIMSSPGYPSRRMPRSLAKPKPKNTNIAVSVEV